MPEVKIKVLIDGLPARGGKVYNKGAFLKVPDSKTLLKWAEQGKIEYLNKDQTDLFGSTN